MIKLHDVHSLHSIDWESKKDGAYVRDSFLPLFQKGVTAFIENVNTQLFLLEIDDLILQLLLITQSSKIHMYVLLIHITYLMR